MIWTKLFVFSVPLCGYVWLVHGGDKPPAPAFNMLTGSIGFLLGGISASTIYEFEKWFAEVSDNHGSATFARPVDMHRAGLYGRQGLIVGKANGRLLRLNQPGHMLTLAPTRTGKGTTAVIPNLLDYPGSVVCVDIKGENVAIAGRRRRDFGPVLKFAPFEADSCCFNVFDFIRGGDDAWEDAAMLADLLVVPSGAAKSVFFENEARALLTAMILYVAMEAKPERRNMAEVRRMLMVGERGLNHHLEKMKNASHPAVRRAANSFTQKEDRLKSSFMAEAQSNTLVFDSQRVARVTSRSDFDLTTLKHNVASLFLVIPPEHMDVYRPLVRLLLGVAVRAMTRDYHRPDHEVLFLVDEFPALGKMAPLVGDAGGGGGLAYLAGYGCKLWLFAQDLGQLEAVYGKAPTRSILANTNLQTFSTMDQATAELISKMIGNETRQTSQKSKTRRSWFVPDYHAFNMGSGETGRPLLTPDEVRVLGDDRQLLFIKGLRPVLCRKVPYFRERLFLGLWDLWRGNGGQDDG